VCPTGVDIRDGANLGCIQCGLCIDACDAVMAKLGWPTRLIAYDTEVNIRRRLEGKPALLRVVRPRTVIYAGIIALVGAIMVYSLATRESLGLNVIHDRNPIFVRLADGAIRNAYTVRILNKRTVARRFALAIEGVPGASLEIVGEPTPPDGDPAIEVGPDQTREVRVLVTDHGTGGPSSAITFTVIDRATGEAARASDHFRRA